MINNSRSCWSPKGASVEALVKKCPKCNMKGEDANPKYICYCSRVTEEDIKRAIEDGANTLKDVIIKTGAMKNCNCEINNPRGKCCSNDIKKVMEKYMGIWQKQYKELIYKCQMRKMRWYYVKLQYMSFSCNLQQ